MSLILVTGASRGFGLAVTQAFQTAFPSSHFIVTARSKDHFSKDSLEHWALDFSSLDWMSALKTYLEPLKKQKFQHVYLINNAGSLGPLDKIPNLDPNRVMEAISSNLSANIIFTSQLLKNINASAWTIVNISSLAA
jgi:benzil reductase ((S)-benzoin forming)